MRLSEAIRLGSMLHPQCFGKPYEFQVRVVPAPDAPSGYRVRNELVGTCAMGAAKTAGYDVNQACDVTALQAHCPACYDPLPSQAIGAVVAHLNDWHKWTRERIADWVETKEDAENVRLERVAFERLAAHADVTAAPELSVV